MIRASQWTVIAPRTPCKAFSQRLTHCLSGEGVRQSDICLVVPVLTRPLRLRPSCLYSRAWATATAGAPVELHTLVDRPNCRPAVPVRAPDTTRCKSYSVKS